MNTNATARVMTMMNPGRTAADAGGDGGPPTDTQVLRAALKKAGANQTLIDWLNENLTGDQSASLVGELADKEDIDYIAKKDPIAAACFRAERKLQRASRSGRGYASVHLTARELEKCAAKGPDPAKYAKTKAASSR